MLKGTKIIFILAFFGSYSQYSFSQSYNPTIEALKFESNISFASSISERSNDTDNQPNTQQAVDVNSKLYKLNLNDSNLFGIGIGGLNLTQESSIVTNGTKTFVNFDNTVKGGYIAINFHLLFVKPFEVSFISDEEENQGENDGTSIPPFIQQSPLTEQPPTILIKFTGLFDRLSFIFSNSETDLLVLTDSNEAKLNIEEKTVFINYSLINIKTKFIFSTGIFAKNNTIKASVLDLNNNAETMVDTEFDSNGFYLAFGLGFSKYFGFVFTTYQEEIPEILNDGYTIKGSTDIYSFEVKFFNLTITQETEKINLEIDPL